MINGLIPKVLLISALALSGIILTTPVWAFTPEQHSNSKWVAEFYQRVWFSKQINGDKLELYRTKIWEDC